MSARPGDSIGLLGCGNISNIVVARAPELAIAAVYDLDQSRATKLAARCGARVCRSFEELVAQDFAVLVEAASVDAARQHACDAVGAGKDLVMLSVGALAEQPFRAHLLTLARSHKRTVHIPSGAIAGLDCLRAASIAGIEQLTLKTTKPPRALDVTIAEPKCLYRGSAIASIEEFPKNVNVAVAVTVAAGRDADLELWADPSVDRNIHEVIAEGHFGRLQLKLQNEPSPENPKTSYLAALSVIALLKGLDDPFVIGS